MEFVFVLAEVIVQILFINFSKIVEVVGALFVDALMDDKVLAVLLGSKGMAAVWTTKRMLFGEAVIYRRKRGIADLA